VRFTQAELGRIFVLRLNDGDRLPKVVEKFAAENKISGALCFFLGGAKDGSRVVVGPKQGHVLPPEPMVTLLEGVFEALEVGTIFKNEKDKPKLHMHSSFGRNQKTITGCVRMGVDVWRIGEVVILELTGSSARRAIDQETGFEFLESQ
jgi:predicted DNA-binding protein with PD1-like motif